MADETKSEFKRDVQGKVILYRYAAFIYTHSIYNINAIWNIYTCISSSSACEYIYAQTHIQQGIQSLC